MCKSRFEYTWSIKRARKVRVKEIFHDRNKTEIAEGELVQSVDLIAQSTVNFIKTVLFSLGEIVNEDSDNNLMYFLSPKNQINTYKVETRCQVNREFIADLCRAMIYTLCIINSLIWSYNGSVCSWWMH